MSATAEAALSNQVDMLRTTPQYKQLLSLVNQITAMHDLPKDPATLITDVILRSIARDITVQIGAQVILHITVIK